MGQFARISVAIVGDCEDVCRGARGLSRSSEGSTVQGKVRGRAASGNRFRPHEFPMPVTLSQSNF